MLQTDIFGEQSNADKINYLVSQVLQMYPEARDNDPLLIGAVWKLQGLDIDIAIFSQNKMLARAETIVRTRRKLQEKGYFESSPQIKAIRQNLAKKHEHKSIS